MKIILWIKSVILRLKNKKEDGLAVLEKMQYFLTGDAAWQEKMLLNI